MWIRHRPMCLLCLLAAGTLACDDHEKRPDLETTPDTAAPAQIEDLRITATSCSTVNLVWTATGDDETEGQAAAYDLRYDDTEITEENWEAARSVAIQLVPKVSGEQEALVVLDLPEMSAAYFGMKVIDESENASGLSNVVTTITPTCPNTIDDPTPAELRSAPTEIWIAGHRYALDAYPVRDFMPGGPLPGLACMAWLEDLDSLDVPDGVEITALWVINHQDVWYTVNPPRTDGWPHQLEVVACDGPFWDPGTKVHVVARVTIDGLNSYWLIAPNLVIDRTS